MNNELLFKKLSDAREARFHYLNEYERKRMAGAVTMYIPGVPEVAIAIRSIPAGSTRTIRELRKELAAYGKAETSCPATLLKYWKWMADLSEEYKSKYVLYDIPWWRVLKDGKCSRHMPGGIEYQSKLLLKEGIIVH